MSKISQDDDDSSTDQPRGLSRRKFLQRSMRGVTAGAVGAVSTRSIFGAVAEAQEPIAPTSGFLDGAALVLDDLGPQQLMLDGTFEFRGLPHDTNHAWAIQLMEAPAGGAFALTADNGRLPPCTTTLLAYDAGAGEIEAALNALPIFLTAI